MHGLAASRSARLRRSTRALARASWADRALLAETVVCLAAARIAVRLLPFRVIAARLTGEVDGGSVAGDPPAAARRLAAAVGAVASYTPWRSKCLEQAIAAKAMLRRRGIPSTLYVGVARDPAARRPIVSHAWLRSGTLNVTGGDDVSRYAVITSFADTPGAQPPG